MVLNREQAVCFGRSFVFATGGFMEKFKAWVVRPPVASPVVGVSGGPGWYVIDDQSGLGADPYIVVSNHTAANIANFPNWFPDLAEPHKILKVGFVTANAGEMYCRSYLWWNATTHVGYGLYGRGAILDVDSGNFVYDFRGGPNFMSIASRIGTLWDHVILDELVGDPVILEDDTHIGAVQSPLVAGINVTIQLNTGEASNFTANKCYYIYDFKNTLAAAPLSATNYVKVLSVDTYTDQIVVDQIRYNYPAGSVIGSYPHRFYFIKTREQTGCAFQSHLSMPYCSVPSTVASWVMAVTQSETSFGPAMFADQNEFFLKKCAPDDELDYLTEPILIAEYLDAASASTYMNRAYGPGRNVVCTSDAGIAQMLDGRLIGGLQYVCALISGTGTLILWTGSSGLAFLVPDFDSIV